MKIKEIKEKSTEELQDILKETQQKLREHNFGAATAQIKDVRQIRKTRKLIAQILTILNSRK